MSDLKPIRRALLSVTDKTGLVDFARVLKSFAVELISTGGTAAALREAGLPVRDVAELTGFPEMLGGRVKTLHPVVHGGILHRRGDPEHVEAVRLHGIGAIDMVVVNLYAFEKTAARQGVELEELIENIDIGGPSMLRSAAKNFEDVAVVSSVAQYAELSGELRSNAGSLSQATRWKLCQAAFATTAAYDAGIATVLEGCGDRAARNAAPDASEAGATKAALPSKLRILANRKSSLRYGENPHQAAALYSDGSGAGIANAEQMNGKELSFNNLVDLDACWALAREFKGKPAVAIIKHTNPCGVAEGETLEAAYRRALEADPVSAFGGVIGVNAAVDGAAAAEMVKLFVEAIVAPEFTAEALEILRTKKNLRLLRIGSKPQSAAHAPELALKQISGGFLLQEEDLDGATPASWTVPTARKPSVEETAALQFAWIVCKHVKSNAIVYARSEGGFGQSVGVGAGQMSRVDAARFGAMKAVLPLAGTVAASDAFFPFADGLETVAQAGATAVIQPGGSVRDAEVVAAADRLGIAMAFTGIRHFRHG